MRQPSLKRATEALRACYHPRSNNDCAMLPELEASALCCSLSCSFSTAFAAEAGSRMAPAETVRLVSRDASDGEALSTTDVSAIILVWSLSFVGRNGTFDAPRIVQSHCLGISHLSLAFESSMPPSEVDPAHVSHHGSTRYDTRRPRRRYTVYTRHPLTPQPWRASPRNARTLVDAFLEFLCFLLDVVEDTNASEWLQ